jgi:hypothetical protein
MEKTTDDDVVAFPRSAEGWISLFEERGFEYVWAKGFAFDPLLRSARRLVSALRLWGTSHTDVGVDPARRAEKSLKRRRSRIRRGAYAFLLAPIVALSYVLEPLSEVLVGDRLSSHVALVLQKKPR